MPHFIVSIQISSLNIFLFYLYNPEKNKFNI